MCRAGKGVLGDFCVFNENVCPMSYKRRFHCLYVLYALLLGPVLCNRAWSPHHLRSLFFSAALLFLFLVLQYASDVFFFFPYLGHDGEASRQSSACALPVLPEIWTIKNKREGFAGGLGHTGLQQGQRERRWWGLHTQL
jgi:hypothetical protein